MRIDVISDVVCPWCYVGRKKLALALDGRSGDEVVFHPFELDPGVPPGAGEDYKGRLTRKFGGAGRVDAAWARISEIGRSLGIHFAFDKIGRAQNSLDAHRLLAWALDEGGPALQGQLVDRLFAAHFEEGRAIDDPAVLAELAQAVGMDGEGVRARLASDADRQRIRDDVAQAHALGVSGVPTFVFAQRLAVGGAQDPQVLRQAMEQAER